jgi:hypothetical protein
MVLTETELVIEIHRRIAELQNTHDARWRELRADLRLHMQETRFHREGLLARLDILEEKATRPIIDWSGIIQNLWFKVAILIALLSGNAKLIDAVQIAFKN